MTEDKPAKPFALLLGAPLPVKNRHVFAPADDAERIDVFGQASRKFTVCELVARHDLIHGKRQGTGEIPCELSVFAFVRMPDEVAPQRVGNGSDRLIGVFNDVHARLSAAGREQPRRAHHRRTCRFLFRQAGGRREFRA